MIIHPTRTNLLILREKAESVRNSISILKARRQALMKEFLETALPLLKSREELRKVYGKALRDLFLSKGHEGRESIESVALITEKELGVSIGEGSLWGLRYKELLFSEPGGNRKTTEPILTKKLDQRPYDFLSTTEHLEESIYGFEKIVEAIFEIANFESKVKRLADEILKTTRRIRVLEERILPQLKSNIKNIEGHLAERERESFYRLKIFKRKTET